MRHRTAALIEKVKELVARKPLPTPKQTPADAVLCPQQIGKTTSCGTCGLCWQTRRRIAFLRH